MAATVETANGTPAAQQPVPAQVVGNAFVQQYYHILHNSPGLVYRFYQDISTLGRTEEDGTMSVTTTMQGINEKIVSLNYGNFRAEVKSVDSQESFNGGIQVLVTGYLTAENNTVRNFAQSFFLAPQDRGYFVLNDVLRYLNNIDQGAALVDDVIDPVTPEQVPSPVLENHVSDQSTTSAEELTPGKVYNPPENGDAPAAEDVPVEKVVDETPNNVHTDTVVVSSAKIEEVPKKSYASIVKHFKGSAAQPPTAPRKELPKSVEQVNRAPVSAQEVPVSSSDVVDNDNNQDADGYSIYIRGLPANATEALVEGVFTKFGTIKIDGIQIRTNWHQGFCFGFVEFEDAISVQKAVEASPVAIGERQVIVEEKRSTFTQGNNRGRFQSQRGSGFRNDGIRGHGNAYGGNRGFNRSDFNGRSDNVNRGGNRAVSANGDGNNNGGYRANGSNGLVNGAAKNMPPHVSATA